MKENLSRLDRSVRMAISFGFLSYGFLSNAIWVLLIGIVLLVTSLFGWCPVKQWLKKN